MSLLRSVQSFCSIVINIIQCCCFFCFFFFFFFFLQSLNVQLDAISLGMRPGPKVKIFSMLNSAEHEIQHLRDLKQEASLFVGILVFMSLFKFLSIELSMKRVSNLGACIMLLGYPQ